MNFIHHTLRFLLASVFLIASTVKLMDMEAFVENVGDFGLVPDQLVVATAWFFVVAELAVGIGLVVNLSMSLFAATIMLGCFIAVLLYGIGLGLDVHCGCFGAGFRVSLQTQLIIDIGLIFLCGAVSWSGKLAERLMLPSEQIDPTSVQSN